MVEDERRVAGWQSCMTVRALAAKPKWMERECQSLMCLMARRDIEIENISKTKQISAKENTEH